MFEFPAWSLLDAMMMAARWADVALVGVALRPRAGVVEVGVAGLGAAPNGIFFQDLPN